MARERAHTLIASGTWSSPSARAAAQARKELKFGQIAEQWLRLRRLRPRTVEGYRHLLDRYVLPEFGDLAGFLATQGVAGVEIVRAAEAPETSPSSGKFRRVIAAPRGR